MLVSDRLSPVSESVANQPVASPVRASRRFPVLEMVGKLTPNLALMGKVFQASFEIGAFKAGEKCVPELAEFLATKGYEIDDFHEGMLFATDAGVQMHTDEGPSVLWALGGFNGCAERNHEMVVGNQSAFLVNGGVYLFDSGIRHGLIANRPGLWVVYSAYVRKRKAPAKPRAMKG